METITVSTIVKAPAERVWELWTDPAHIIRWYHASDDWHAPHAENDLRVGGRFVTRMAALDGSAGFDFGGTYTEIAAGKRLGYVIDGGWEVLVTFEVIGGGIEVTETFEAETAHSIGQQRAGWQSILEHFRKYAEGSAA